MMNRNSLQNNLAMTMILISGAMLFATLLMGYAIYRSSAPVWPPMGIIRVSLGFPILSTLTILLSSWFSHKVKAEVKSGQLKKAKLNLDTTIILGLMFLGIQTLLWAELRSSGLYVESGIFASILHAFTWIHAAHVVLGLSSLIWLRCVLKHSTLELWQKALNVEKFWHFLGIVWFIIFLTLFVL